MGQVSTDSAPEDLREQDWTMRQLHSFDAHKNHDPAIPPPIYPTTWSSWYRSNYQLATTHHGAGTPLTALSTSTTYTATSSMQRTMTMSPLSKRRPYERSSANQRRQRAASAIADPTHCIPPSRCHSFAQALAAPRASPHFSAGHVSAARWNNASTQSTHAQPRRIPPTQPPSQHGTDKRDAPPSPLSSASTKHYTPPTLPPSDYVTDLHNQTIDPYHASRPQHPTPRYRILQSAVQK